jgi:hypothetical protein
MTQLVPPRVGLVRQPNIKVTQDSRFALAVRRDVIRMSWLHQVPACALNARSARTRCRVHRVSLVRQANMALRKASPRARTVLPASILWQQVSRRARTVRQASLLSQQVPRRSGCVRTALQALMLTHQVPQRAQAVLQASTIMSSYIMMVILSQSASHVLQASILSQ